MATLPFVPRAAPNPSLGSWHHGRENHSPGHGPLGKMRPQLQGGHGHEPPSQDPVLAPRRAGMPGLAAPACAPPLPGASQRPFVPLSPGTPVPEKFRKKNQRHRQNRPARPRSSGQGRWDRAKAATAAGGVPSKAEGRVGGSPRNRKSPRLHSGVEEVAFFQVKRRTPSKAAGGSRGGGSGCPSAAGGRSGGAPRLPSHPAGLQRPRPAQDELLPPGGRPHRASAAPLGKRQRPPGPSRPPSPEVRCQAQGFPSAARARPDPLARRFLPRASGWRRPSLCAPPRRAPAFPPENKGLLGPQSLPSYRGVSPGAAALLPGAERWRDGPRPPEAAVSVLPAASDAGAGRKPRTLRVEGLERPTGAGQGRLPRKGFELGGRTSQRVWSGLVLFSPRF